ncbi:unnamed protein product [Protopolystoma xenopodis]|uniref:Uncharacterized protein n=1 Tax=Protopolystoma xenopodis TaxID=117903 RepID=A0A3S5B2D1_9PLAT|nr:unnamed protein product [Protopolystoma xenopodis]
MVSFPCFTASLSRCLALQQKSDSSTGTAMFAPPSLHPRHLCKVTWTEGVLLRTHNFVPIHADQHVELTICRFSYWPGRLGASHHPAPLPPLAPLTLSSSPAHPTPLRGPDCIIRNLCSTDNKPWRGLRQPQNSGGGLLEAVIYGHDLSAAAVVNMPGLANSLASNCIGPNNNLYPSLDSSLVRYARAEECATAEHDAFNDFDASDASLRGSRRADRTGRAWIRRGAGNTARASIV